MWRSSKACVVGNNDRALLLLLRMAVREEVVDLPADIDWREIKDRTFRQGVGGIVFDVVENFLLGSVRRRRWCWSGWEW